jgi:hypothetical protein
MKTGTLAVTPAIAIARRLGARHALWAECESYAL